MNTLKLSLLSIPLIASAFFSTAANAQIGLGCERVAQAYTAGGYTCRAGSGGFYGCSGKDGAFVLYEDNRRNCFARVPLLRPGPIPGTFPAPRPGNFPLPRPGGIVIPRPSLEKSFSEHEELLEIEERLENY